MKVKEPNKASRIRDYLKSNPGSTNFQVLDALPDVTIKDVQQVRYTARKKLRKQIRKHKRDGTPLPAGVKITKGSKPDAKRLDTEIWMAVQVPLAGCTIKLMQDPARTFGTMHVTRCGISYLHPNAKNATKVKARKIKWEQLTKIMQLELL